MLSTFRRSLALSLVSCLSIVCGYALPASAQVSNKVFKMGAYDPYGTFAIDDRIGIEHIFFPWEDSNLESLKTAAAYAAERRRDLLITLEPWSWAQERPLPTPIELYQAIMAGQHDERIRTICAAASSLPVPVTLRWGHEMDLRNGRFPWSQWEPAQFIDAYRHFVDVCRTAATNLSFMWSPRGEAGLQQFYPGDQYVDSIGLTMFGYQAYEVGEYGKALTLSDRLGPTYQKVAAYEKDIYITEFGCHGDERYVKQCLDEAKASQQEFPKVAGLIYFNEVETFAWPEPYGLPDWRSFSTLVASLDK